MKKLIYCALALATGLFAASCQQENLEPVAQGNTVTFTVEIPELATKAPVVDDGTNINDLVYAVYWTEAESLLQLQENPKLQSGLKLLYKKNYTVDPFNGTGRTTVNVELLNDKNYIVLFWAQVSETWVAGDNFDLISVSYPANMQANSNNYAAFSGVSFISKNNLSGKKDVTLKRPFAQLNIGTTLPNDKTGEEHNFDVAISKTSVKVKNAGTSFNLIKQVAEGNATVDAPVVFAEAAAPKNPDGTDVKLVVNNIPYTYAAMNYVFANGNVEVDYVIDLGEYHGTVKNTVSNVPVAANYRTNIIGNLLTGTTEYNVVLDDFDTNDNSGNIEVITEGLVKNINGDYEVSNKNGLAHAINNLFAEGGTFYVLKNIDMTGVSYDPADVPAGTTVHIVGEAPVVTRSSGPVERVEISGLTKPLLKTVQRGAAASFANILIDAPIDFVQTNNGVVAFNNCDNDTPDSADDLVGDNTYGTIAGEGTNINNLALENALKANASSIKLAGDITASEIIVVDYPVTIDGCGHTLTSTAGRAINVSGANGVTIKNLVINCSGERAINIIQNATNVTIDNVTATAANYTVNVAPSAPGAVVNIENSTLNGLCTVNVASPGAKVTVDNSTINCNDTNTTEGEAYAAIGLNKDAVRGKIIVTNSTINVTEGSDSMKARNGAEDGIITIDESEKEVTVQVAAITFEDSDYYYSFTSLEEAIAYAQKYNRPVTLIRNITVAKTVTIEEGQTVILDLNGKTIAGTMHKSVGAVVENNGTLTIQNGTISSTATNGGAAVLNKGTLTITDAIVNGAPSDTATGYASYAVNTDGVGSSLVVKDSNISGLGSIGATNGTKVTINDGTYHTPAVASGHAVYADGEGTEVVINDGIFSEGYEYDPTYWGMYQIHSSNKAKVTVNGGTFMPWDCANGYDLSTASEGTIVIYGGTFAEDPASQNNKNYVAEGYISLKLGDENYTVVPANGTLTMNGGSTLNLGGFEFKGTIEALGDLTIIGDTKIKTLKATNGGTITIQDGKTLTLNNFSFGSKDTASAEYEIKGGTVVANYGFFQHGKYTLYSNFETGYMYYSYGSDIKVCGTFHSKGAGDGLDYVRGNLTIANGGKSIHDKSLWVGQPAGWGAMNASLVIEEGGYVQANSLSVYEGSSLTYSNDADLKYNSVTGTEYITKK